MKPSTSSKLPSSSSVPSSSSTSTSNPNPRPIYRGRFNPGLLISESIDDIEEHSDLEGSTDQDTDGEDEGENIDEGSRLMGSDDDEPQSIQIDVPQMRSGSGSGPVS